MNRPNRESFRAKRSLGQNFLSDPKYVHRIVKALTPSAADTVIEIGPGRAALTAPLVGSGAEVIAIELDRELIQPLRERFDSSPNFRVIEQDALTADLNEIVAARDSRGPIKLVANLPYYISTAILQHLAAQRNLLDLLVLMFQREVVERMTAPPGTSDRGFLTVWAESAFTIERLFDVPPAAFRPIPKVWSSVVRLVPKPRIEGEASFRQLVSAAFAQKRKTLANNLKSRYANYSQLFASAGIDPSRRAESLTLEEWYLLHEALLAG